MRMYRIIIMTFVAAMAAALFSACSADEPEINKENPLLPDSDYESRSFADMVDPASDISMKFSDIKSYRKDDWTNGGWEEFDLSDYAGWSLPTPSIIVIKDGKMYTEMESWSSTYGPTYFATALDLLMTVRAVKRGTKILISRDFDIEANVIIAGNTSLNVKNIKGDKLWLATIEDYYGGRTHTGGQHLYVATYNIGKGYKDPCMHFDTVEDAYAWLIEKFRARFGEEVNRNYYTGGMIIYDQPMFSVAMIEYELQRYLAGDLVL